MVASALVIVVPGVDMALMTRQVVAHGRRAALVTLVGGLTGGLTHTALATLGLSAVLTASAAAYTAVKIVGATYLVVVGVQTIWASRQHTGSGGHDIATDDGSPRRPMTVRRAYALGLTSNLTNPKMAVFFLTFLPQFVTPGPHLAAQTAVLGLLFSAMACSWFVAYIFALDRVSPWFGRPSVRRSIERVTGAVLVALGVRLAVQR